MPALTGPRAIFMVPRVPDGSCRGKGISRMPVEDVHRLQGEIAKILELSRTVTGSLVAARYRVRINLIGKLVGDRVFCYRRMTAASALRDHRQAVDAAQASLAARN